MQTKSTLMRTSTVESYLDQLVPATGHDDGVAAIRGETHARHPLRVALILQEGIHRSQKKPFIFLNTEQPVDEQKRTWMVYLHTPKVFQSLMVLSLDPETICRLSAEKATLRTSFVCPTKRRVVVPLQEQGDRQLHRNPSYA